MCLKLKMTTWLPDINPTWLQKFCINVLKCGPIPGHVAFIMDGNRRYARKTNSKKIVGHSKGFEKMTEIFMWCKELGVKEVTVYAFSIENFQRSKEEVDVLMDLATEKFLKIVDEEEKIMKEGIRVRVIGNMSFTPDSLKKLFARIVLLTANNTRCTLNIAFAYNARDEITHSVRTVIKGVESNLINIDDVSETVLSQCLQICSSPDILIRTSGEVRLSNFLLWQIYNTEIHFIDVLWPEFNMWHLIVCIFKYQRSVGFNSKFNENLNENCSKITDEKITNFLKVVREDETKKLLEILDN